MIDINEFLTKNPQLDNSKFRYYLFKHCGEFYDSNIPKDMIEKTIKDYIIVLKIKNLDVDYQDL